MKRAPGWIVAALLCWLCWAALAPVVAGKVPGPRFEAMCRPVDAVVCERAPGWNYPICKTTVK